MTKLFLVSTAVVGFLAGAAAAATNLNSSKSNALGQPKPAAAPPPAPAKLAPSGTIAGLVSAVKPADKSLTLRRRDGSLVVMDVSKIPGGLPTVGTSVRIRYATVNGKPTAQAIAVNSRGPSSK